MEKEEKPKLADLVAVADAAAGEHGDRGLSISISTAETAPDRDSRIREAEADARTRRTKETVLFFAVIVGVVLLAIVAVKLILSPTSSPDDKKWATTILSAMVTGGIGYLTGRGSKQ